MLHGIGGLFVAAVAGYWVLERAEGHRGTLRKVGRFLGWVIILASLTGVVCRVWAVSTGKLPCPSGWNCPFLKSPSKTPASPSASPRRS